MNNLRKLRGDKSQAIIAKKLEISQRTYSNYESGKSEINKEILKKAAALFNVSADYILGISDTPRPIKGKLIPVLGHVPAGIPLEAVEDIIDFEEISPDMSELGDIFGLRVKGDSMSPLILDGDTVLIRKQNCADSGDIVVVYVNGYEATLKRIKYDDNGLYLIPINQAYNVQFYSKNEIEKMPVVICGKMIEIRRKFY